MCTLFLLQLRQLRVRDECSTPFGQTMFLRDVPRVVANQGFFQPSLLGQGFSFFGVMTGDFIRPSHYSTESALSPRDAAFVRTSNIKTGHFCKMGSSPVLPLLYLPWPSSSTLSFAFVPFRLSRHAAICFHHRPPLPLCFLLVFFALFIS